MGEWSFCGKDIPKSEIVFFSQIIAISLGLGLASTTSLLEIGTLISGLLCYLAV